MKKLLSTTTALSLALMHVQPLPVLAQAPAATVAEDGSILAADGTILCQPTADAPCNPLDFGLDLDAAPKVGGGLLGRLRSGQQPEAAPAEPPAEPAAPEAQVPEAAAPEAPMNESADEPPQAPAEQPEAIAPEPAPMPEATPEPAPEPAAAPEPQEQAAPKPGDGTLGNLLKGRSAREEPAAEPAAPAAPAPEGATPETAAPQDAAADTAPEQAETVTEPLPAEIQDAFDKAAEAEARAAQSDATAEPAPAPVDAPDVPAEAAETVDQLLSGAGLRASGILGALADETQGGADVTAPTADAPLPEPQAVTETTITEADTRSSFEEFAKAPEVLEGGRKKSGLSDLEKAGLIALGAIVVGKMLSDGREVVANTGDRVVVRNPDGDYQVYKDDDTLLRRPGANVRTESYRDGSTRTTVTRDDGSQVVTIRDATGRVLRRALYDVQGNETVLIDDLLPEQRIDVSTLPEPIPDRTSISPVGDDAALRAELARIEAQRLGRSFSLRQIREISEVRKLAAVIDVDNITFDTGSAVIRTTEARKLADLGRTMGDILDANPSELFLIEGHTDAVGSAASNLALSDRRAESVALALTEYFAIPPENMIVQGYGEYDLRVRTDGDERRNRRVAVRLISPLLQTASR